MQFTRLSQKKIKSLSAIKQELKADKFNFDIISFDLFDTLLFRRIDPPEIIHETVSKYMVNICNKFCDTPIPWEEALKERYLVETQLRQKSTGSGYDHECRFKDIITGWIQRLYPRINDQSILFINKIIDFELSLEKEALYPNPEAESLLSWIKDKNKKIIIISDMYLESEHLHDIIQATVLKKYIDEIFVSSDKLICKYSAKLFHNVCKSLQCKTDRIIHIGDNEISDFKIPLSIGIRAFHLDIPAEFKRKKILNTHYTFGKKSIYWRGKHLVEIAKSFQAENHNCSWYKNYGYQHLGAFFCTYISGVIEKIQELDIDHIYFLARDGYLFQKLYQLFKKNCLTLNGKNVPHTYAYLTRKTTAAASVYKGMTHNQATVGLYNPKQHGLFSILSTYSLPVSHFTELARKHGFQDIRQPISDWNDPRLLSFLEDAKVQKQIKIHSAKNRTLLKNYLDQIKYFENKRIALIDIGWNGSIQYFLSKAFHDDHKIEFPETWGLYFGYVNGIPYNFSSKDVIHGIIFDDREPLANNKICHYFEEIFEESSRAPDATVTNYEKDLGTQIVKPVFKENTKPDRKAEIQSNPLIHEMQEGILEFACHYISASNMTNYDPKDIKPFIKTMAERIVVYPKRKEVKMLTKLSHSEDFGGDNIMNLKKIKYSRRHFFKIPFLKQKINASDWKYGTLVSMGLRRIMAFIRLFDLKKY